MTSFKTWAVCEACQGTRDCRDVGQEPKPIWCCADCDPKDAAEEHWAMEDYKTRRKRTITPKPDYKMQSDVYTLHLGSERDNTATDPCIACLFTDVQS